MEVLKIGVFYDGNYFLHVSNYYSYYSEVRRRLSLPGFHKFLCHAVAHAEGVSEASCRVVTGHYFRGRLNAQDASHRCRQLYNDRVFDDVLMSVGVETHYLPLRTRMGRKEEKGIDVWLALEAYERALQYKLDVVVLVSSDGEYVPLIRKLSTLGVRVMVLNWEFDYCDESGHQVSTRSSSDLLSEVSYALDVDNLIREGLQAADPIVEELFMPETAEENAYKDEEDFPYGNREDQLDDSLSEEDDYLQNNEDASQKRVYLEDSTEKKPMSILSRFSGVTSGDDEKSRGEMSQHYGPGRNGENEWYSEEMSQLRYRSRIVNLISDKGYGFIEYSPKNLFFYHRDLVGVGIVDLRVGDEVEFSIGPGRNGNDIAAKQIKLVEGTN